MGSWLRKNPDLIALAAICLALTGGQWLTPGRLNKLAPQPKSVHRLWNRPARQAFIELGNTLRDLKLELPECPQLQLPR